MLKLLDIPRTLTPPPPNLRFAVLSENPRKISGLKRKFLGTYLDLANGFTLQNESKLYVFIAK